MNSQFIKFMTANMAQKAAETQPSSSSKPKTIRVPTSIASLMAIKTAKKKLPLKWHFKFQD
jgi:hypothetical protein